MNEPLIPMKSSTQAEKASYECCERFNRLSLMLLKSHMGKVFMGPFLIVLK